MRATSRAGSWAGWALSACAFAAASLATDDGALGSSARAQGAGAGADAPAEAAPAGVLTKPPALLKFVEADYPAEALAAEQGARVVLNLVLDEAGAVVEASVGTSGGTAFDEAALAAALQFEFSPAEIDGKPASVELQYEYVFTPVKKVVEAPPPPDIPTGAVAGTLLEAGTRKPLAGIRVLIENHNLETFTDADGKFSFAEVPVGDADLLVEDSVYEVIADRETVVAGQETQVSYYVEKVGFENTVVVRAKRPEKEVTRRTINIEEIRTLPGTNGDALKVIQNLPGAARIPFGGGALVLRGGGQSQAYVDTMPIPAAFHFGGLRSTIASALIESIDLTPGNFDAEFGRINGGVVDVRLRAPRKDGIHGYVEADIFDAGALLEGPLGENGSIAVAARRSYIDFVLNAVLPDDAGIQFSTAPRYYDAQVLYEWKKGRDRVRALAYMSNDKIVATIKEPPEDNPTIRGDASFEVAFIGTNLNWEHRFSDATTHEASVAFYVQPINVAVGANVGLKLDNYVVTVRDKLSHKLLDNLELTVGTDTELQFGQVSGQGVGGPPVEGDGGNANNANGTVRGIDDLSIKFVTPSLWTRAEWKLGAFTALPALRLDYFSVVDQLIVQPRLTARFDLDERTSIKAGAGFYAQQANPAYVADGFGNPNLDIETSTHYSLGGSRKLTEAITLDVTGFYKDFFQLVRASDNPDIAYENTGEGRAYGVEVLLRHELTERLYGWLAYTLMRSERRDEPGAPYRVFDFDQTHNLVVIGQYKLTPTWQVGLRFRYVTGNPTTPITGGIYNADSGTYDPRNGRINSDRLDAFHQLDIRVDKMWNFDTWQLVTYIDVQNVYNRANPEGVSYNFDFTQQQNQAGLPIIPSIGLRGQF